MVAHAYDGLPNEACGLLGGDVDVGEVFVPCENHDRSSRTFSKITFEKREPVMRPT